MCNKNTIGLQNGPLNLLNWRHVSFYEDIALQTALIIFIWTSKQTQRTYDERQHRST